MFSDQTAESFAMFQKVARSSLWIDDLGCLRIDAHVLVHRGQNIVDMDGVGCITSNAVRTSDDLATANSTTRQP